MIKRLILARSFWTSKLGRAAFVSVTAMVAMIVVTSQFDTSQDHPATAAQPMVDVIASVELA